MIPPPRPSSRKCLKSTAQASEGSQEDFEKKQQEEARAAEEKSKSELENFRKEKLHACPKDDDEAKATCEANAEKGAPTDVSLTPGGGGDGRGFIQILEGPFSAVSKPVFCN